jgi:Transposase family tnp2
MLNAIQSLGVADSKINVMLQMVNLFCPSNVFVSSQEFIDYFDIPASDVVYVCTQEMCFGEVKVADDSMKCSVCKKRYSKKELISSRSYFKYQPLTPQLLEILENKSMQDVMNSHKENVGLNSIIQSENYKMLRSIEIIHKQDITLQLNTDGVKATKSSKLSFWPIFVSINELPLRTRTENMLLSGVWMGKKKPHMNTFLGPLIKELKVLHEVGVETTQGRVKVHCIVAPVDSPAKADLMCISHPGGKFACPYCFQKAVTIEKGRGRTRIFRRIKSGKQRNKQNYLTFNQKRYQKKKTHYKGIKRVSALASLKPFDIINGFVVDYLHAFCVGLFNHYLDYLTGPEHSKENYSVRNLLKEADEIMKRITPPTELKRLPEALSNYKSWKASLKKEMFLYYLLPVLAALNFPQEYMDHVLLLLYSFRQYLRAQLTDNEKIKARLALTKFLAQLSTLFDESMLIYNTHIITHVSDICERWGGLWDANTFNYESKNGFLAKLHHGTVHQPDQILRNYQRLKVCQATEFSNEDYPNKDFKKLYVELLEQKKLCKQVRRVDNCVLFGTGQAVDGNSSFYKKVAELQPDVNFELTRYKRFMIRKIMACTKDYSRLKRRRNFVFNTNKDKAVIVYSLGVSKNENNEEAVYILVHELQNKNVILASDKNLQITSADFLQEVDELEQDIIMNVEELSQKLCCFNVLDKMYITELVNVLEGD